MVREHIKHVVIIVQENRSFDNFFHGFKGADTADYGYMHDGTKVALRPASLSGQDLSHGWQDALNDWNEGKMDRFDENRLGNGEEAGRYAYQYVDRRYIEPYWSMAEQYVLADDMFATEFGGSFTAHLDLIAATSNLRPTSPRPMRRRGRRGDATRRPERRRRYSTRRAPRASAPDHFRASRSSRR